MDIGGALVKTKKSPLCSRLSIREAGGEEQNALQDGH
jgi:hypothetical protein